MKLLTILAILGAALALGGCNAEPKADEPTVNSTRDANSATPGSTTENPGTVTK